MPVGTGQFTQMSEVTHPGHPVGNGGACEESVSGHPHCGGGGVPLCSAPANFTFRNVAQTFLRSPALDFDVKSANCVMQANEPEGWTWSEGHRCPASSGASGPGPSDCGRLVSFMAQAHIKHQLYVQDCPSGPGSPGVAEKKTREYGEEGGGLAWGRGYSQAPDCRVRTKNRGLMARCRQLRGRFQFPSSLSGSTTGTVRSSRNSTGSCQVREAREACARLPHPQLSYSRTRLLLIEHPLCAGPQVPGLASYCCCNTLPHTEG